MIVMTLSPSLWILHHIDTSAVVGLREVEHVRGGVAQSRMLIATEFVYLVVASLSVGLNEGADVKQCTPTSNWVLFCFP